MTIYFISGHLDYSCDEWTKIYKPMIDNVINKNNNKFIVGDAIGSDYFSIKYLNDNIINKDNVTVYHLHEKPRFNTEFKTIGNFMSDKDRDKQMTMDSDYDILYIRSIDEQKKLYGDKYKKRISGTELNYIRRQKLI